MIEISSYLLAIIQFIIITIVCYYEYKRKSIAIFLWAMLLLLFGSMHLLTVFSEVHKYSMWVYDEASVFVILFSICYLFVRCLQKKKSIIIDFENKNINLLNRQHRYIKITFFIFLLCVGYKMYSLVTYAGSLLDSSWYSMRELASSKGYISEDQIITCLYYYSASSFLLFMYCGKKKMAILTALLVVLVALISRNRIEILPLLVSIIAYYVFKSQGLTIRKLLLFLLLAIVIVILIYALQIFRYYGSVYEFIVNFDLSYFFEQIITNMSEGEGDMSLRDHFYYFIYKNNDFENFNEGHTYLRMLLVFVPTSWSMGLKPPDFAISMGTAVMPAWQGYSVHPTLFGDCYANFGFWGFLLGAFWAIYVNIIDKLATKEDVNYKIGVIVLNANALIIMGRGSVYNSFVLALYGMILMWLIYKLNNLLVGKNK